MDLPLLPFPLCQAWTALSSGRRSWRSWFLFFTSMGRCFGCLPLAAVSNERDGIHSPIRERYKSGF